MGRVQRGGGSGESCRNTCCELKLGLGEADQGSSAAMSYPASPSSVPRTPSLTIETLVSRGQLFVVTLGNLAGGRDH